MRWTVLAASLWLASAAQAGTLLFLNSQPGDYIGQGAGRLVTAADGTFTASRNFDNGVNVDFDGRATPARPASARGPPPADAAAPVPCRTRSICDPSGGARGRELPERGVHGGILALLRRRGPLHRRGLRLAPGLPRRARPLLEHRGEALAQRTSSARHKHPRRQPRYLRTGDPLPRGRDVQGDARALTGLTAPTVRL